MQYNLAEHSQCRVLHEAVRRFNQRIRTTKWPLRSNRYCGNESHELKAFSFSIKAKCDETDKPEYLHLDTSEAYKISLSNGLLLLEADNIWGILHGLETVSQLVYVTPCGMKSIDGVLIEDAPVYPHRGFLVDTSRHYLHKNVIKQFLTAMAMVKMNLFHWHIVDDESFPLQSEVFPDLSGKGAYNPLTHIYTKLDVQEIIEYARLRGIRVMVEIDTPGHTHSWRFANKDLLTPCYSKGKPDGTLGPINPIIEENYNFLKLLLLEVTSDFPEQLIHLGGDEVETQCWDSNPDIIEFMKNHSMSNSTSLQNFYMYKLLNLLHEIRLTRENRQITPVLWQDVFDSGVKLNTSTIIHVWRDGWQKKMERLTTEGFRVILSSCWYLNYIDYGLDWEKFYHCKPDSFQGTDEQKSLVIGGEAAMWGEFVDSTNIIQRSWARGAAVAEALWTTGNRSSLEFAPRIRDLRCKMLEVGISAEPISGPDACADF